MSKHHSAFRDTSSKTQAAVDDWLRDPDVSYDATTVQTADGAQLHVRCYGPRSARPIVFAHGFACRLEYWNPQINRLSHTHRVIVYDQRGLGRSTLGHTGVTAPTLGDDLATILDTVLPPDTPAVVVGHSFGGIAVMAWAQRHPHQVRRYASAILLANTITDRFCARTGLLPFAGRYPTLRRPLISALKQTAFPLPPAASLRRTFRSIVMSPQASRAQVDFMLAMMYDVHPAVRAQWGAGLSTLDVNQGLHHLVVPTTVLVGGRDKLTPPAVAEEIAATLRHRGALHRFVTIPATGHTPSIESQQEFDAEIIELIRLTQPHTDS